MSLWTVDARVTILTSAVCARSMSRAGIGRNMHHDGAVESSGSSNHADFNKVVEISLPMYAEVSDGPPHGVSSSLIE